MSRANRCSAYTPPATEIVGYRLEKLQSRLCSADQHRIRNLAMCVVRGVLAAEKKVAANGDRGHTTSDSSV